MTALLEERPVLAYDGAVEELSAGELSQRVALLKRFRELLRAQRDRFHNYLEALDQQKEVIEQGSAEEIAGHVELEEQIVADIFSIQRVINPLDEMYRTLSPGNGFSTGPGDEVGALKSALENLKTEAVTRSTRNRELLSQRMAALNSEIGALRANNPYKSGKSIYAGAGTASVIDIRG